MTIDLNDRLHRTLESGRLPGLHAAIVVRDGRTLLEHYGEGEDFAWITPDQ